MPPFVLFLAAALLALPAAAADCAALASLALPGGAITFAEQVPAGQFTPPGSKPVDDLPAFCRVAATFRPSPDSDIKFEAWLPASSWNGKFLGVGNGGYAGAISYPALADAIRNGYASASTDTGHTAIPGIDATWALNHPEKVIDFGWRAIHLTAVTAKALVRAYYGEAARRSYFNSCSNGGRQALMEAQRFPEDYDGIISGAPANNWTHLLSNAVNMVKATMADPASYIPASKLPAIQAAALAACDASDGVKDGVIENPLECKTDLAGLLCTGAENDSCLTAPQLAALKVIYGGLRSSKGVRLFPGYPMGGEADPAGWGPWITGAAPGKAAMYGFGTQFFSNIVYGDPAWDFKTFDVDRDLKAAQAKAGQALDSVNPDLSKFRARGGKLILYHGWSDAAIPATSTIDYFRAVEAKMGAAETNSFVRLYLAPGVQHCGGGAGPNNFGQATAPQGDPAFNIAKALEVWVESGTAPGSIVARNSTRTRPLCPYPRVAEYKGEGSTDDAANYRCVASAK
jgi:feruloyl esterase